MKNATLDLYSASFHQPAILPFRSGVITSYIDTQHIWRFATFLLLSLTLYDQYKYRRQKGRISGAAVRFPFLGSLTQSLSLTFATFQTQWATSSFTCMSVLDKFIVITSDRNTAHKVLKTPSHAILAVPSVIKDTYPDTIALLQGQRHAELNKTLSSHFSPTALSSYLPVQEEVITRFLHSIVHTTSPGNEQPVAFLAIFRELNCTISCRTFAGDYMTEEDIKSVARDFNHFTAAVGLFDIPLAKYIPFTTAWLGRRAAFATQETFTRSVKKSRARMSAGAQPTCMIDQWVQDMLACDSYQQQLDTGIGTVKKPRKFIRNYTDEEVGRVMFGHLFGSLEATSSATTWLFQILAHRPDVLHRIRDENFTARGGNINRSFDMAMQKSLVYTHAVIKEVLRYRPPVPMIPYETIQPLVVSPQYTIPSGAMVLPSFYSALHDPVAYPNPDTFDPERWLTGDAASKKKNWLVFGAGPHKCLAQRLVTLTLTHLIGKASLEVDWVHHPTERSEEMKVVASMVPADGCQLTFTKRD